MLTRRRFLSLPISAALLRLAENVLRAAPTPQPDDSAKDDNRPLRPHRLIYVSSPTCQLCRTFEDRELEALRMAGWKIGDQTDAHIQVLNLDAHAEQLSRFKIRSVPALICLTDGQEVRRWDGHSTLDRWTVKQTFSGHFGFPEYPVRGDWWTYDGTTDHPPRVMIDHLLEGYHADKFDIRWLRRLTIDELHSLHSDDHEDQINWQNAVKHRQGLRPKWRDAWFGMDKMGQA